jgi:hypothetical protein
MKIMLKERRKSNWYIAIMLAFIMVLSFIIFWHYRIAKSSKVQIYHKNTGIESEK